MSHLSLLYAQRNTADPGQISLQSNLVSRKMQKVKKKIAMEKRRENKTVSNLEGEKKDRHGGVDQG